MYNMAKLQIVIIAILAVITFTKALESPRLHEDVGLNALELIEKYGYTYERHSIVTPDQYILDMHRIPNSGPPVLLMHGFLSSSADWVNFQNKSLAFLLSNLGYDVWIGNARGNAWSRNHTFLDPDKDKKEFWDFSWHEIGVYDIPAKIDHILATTGHEQLFYIGHSQGTTSFFVMCAEKPEYNDKIRLMSAFGPAAYMNHMTNPTWQIMALYSVFVEYWVEVFRYYEFMQSNEIMQLWNQIMCNEDAPFHEMCSNILFLMFGYDSEQLDEYQVPIITTNSPAGGATKQSLHYMQLIQSGQFRQYDYRNIFINMEKYGQATPPDYEIKKITAPIALHYGQNDWMVAIKDVDRFAKQLPNLVIQNEIDYKKFNHIDFLWARDIIDLLYNDVIASMAEH